jgi:cytoskeletal protein CcmA (bactofilin family)
MAKTGTGLETIIAHGVKLEGDLVAEGDLIIEGDVHGTVKTQSDLRIGDQATLDADIEAGNALVSGTIRGNMTVRGKLELLPSSSMTGDIMTDVLVIGPGAKVNGRITMGVDAAVPRSKKRGTTSEEE